MKLASFNGHGEKIYGQLVNGDQWNGVEEVLAQHQPQQAQQIQQGQRPTVISLNAQKPPPPNQHAKTNNGHWNPANNYTKVCLVECCAPNCLFGLARDAFCQQQRPAGWRQLHTLFVHDDQPGQ